MYLAILDPRTPWYAKLAGGCVVAYALSPIDLIPDPIPIIGYLDDLIIVPLGIWLTRKLIPPAVLEECRTRADEKSGRASWLAVAGMVFIGAIWLATAAALIWAGRRWAHAQPGSVTSHSISSTDIFNSAPVARLAGNV